MIPIHHTGIMFRPDSSRVIVRPFLSQDPQILEHMIQRAMSLTEEQVDRHLEALHADFLIRHRDLELCWRDHFKVIDRALCPPNLTPARKLYLGALFSGEYAIESAALFNPSIVPHPDQSGVPHGGLRFILSLRATGEGHISSIEFRSGLIHPEGALTMDRAEQIVTAPTVKENPTYVKSAFLHKLREMGFENKWSQRILDDLQEEFTREELEHSLGTMRQSPRPREMVRTVECVRWLAHSNYEVHFPASVSLSQRIIFPVSANESNGIEDARFVRFVDGGHSMYYATYTAYNGRAILPQLIETRDFSDFRIRTLNGRAVQNKGMALFPRRIQGRFAMISRQDDENLLLMFSDNLHFWNEATVLARPEQPWEFVKIGNCGSPIETEAGWLLITHGVGPMRRYCIGAMLLDREDPSRVIGRLKSPLVEPSGEYREGYVPNVVYSCGSLIHNGRLILPYALSDTRSTIATVNLYELLDTLTSSKGTGSAS
jgi:predicted GH43/DUF377 family glycosyl hydrolase